MLESSAGEKLSNELENLFQEIRRRSTAFVNVGRTSLIECGPELRKQALTNKDLSKLCLPAGENHLVVLPGQERKFASTLELLGFFLG
ncbi:MAG: hypothetical protein ACQES8_03775 [Thermodesulfobacteriota bacterium]